MEGRMEGGKEGGRMEGGGKDEGRGEGWREGGRSEEGRSEGGGREWRAVMGARRRSRWWALGLSSSFSSSVIVLCRRSATSSVRPRGCWWAAFVASERWWPFSIERGRGRLRLRTPVVVRGWLGWVLLVTGRLAWVAGGRSVVAWGFAIGSWWG